MRARVGLIDQQAHMAWKDGLCEFYGFDGVEPDDAHVERVPACCCSSHGVVWCPLSTFRHAVCRIAPASSHSWPGSTSWGAGIAR
jgi:hypothetical protein